MSQIKLTRRGSDPVQSLVNNIQSHIDSQGTDFANAEQTDMLISLESIDQNRQALVQNHFDETLTLLRDTINSVPNLGLEGIEDGSRTSNVGLMAGALAAMAAGDPAAYAKKAYLSKPQAADGVTVVEPMMGGDAGRMDYGVAPALEAFDEKELRQHLSYSIAFNVFASRQDEFSEAFYPTTVVTPDQGGLDITIGLMQVFGEVRRRNDGKVTDFGKRNLIDAAVDPTILADETTRLVPVRLSDNSNASAFVPASAVGAYGVVVSGISVPTAPLAMGKEFDLLALSQYEPLIGAGLMDNSDAIDSRIELSALYLLPATGAKAVKFVTQRLPRSTFMKSTEGNYREMNLQFGTRDLVINKDKKAADGTDVDAFAAIEAGELTVRLGADVNGTVNVETGKTRVFSSPVIVESIVDSTNQPIDLSSGAGASIKNALEAMSFVGYELRTNRTNSNRRTRGHQLDTTYFTERHSIPLGSPLSIPSPAVGQGRDAADLKALVTAARIRNSNNAVTQLFNYASVLEELVKGPKRPGVVPAIPGIGRYLVEPFFERHTLDIEKSINSIRSGDKFGDISAVLIAAIKDISYRAYRDSKYQPALDALTGGTGEKPTLVVGTDQVLIQHLMVQGDTRTWGPQFEDSIVVKSYDVRMRNKIVLTFVRQKADGPDALSFGTHAWVPELTSSIVVNRNGATIKEAMVQPRTLHVNHLPILAIIDVRGLSKVLADKIATPATATDITNPYLAGLVEPEL